MFNRRNIEFTIVHRGGSMSCKDAVEILSPFALLQVVDGVVLAEGRVFPQEDVMAPPVEGEEVGEATV